MDSPIARAEAALLAGRLHEAEGICLDLLARQPQHMGAQALRGAAMLARGDAAAALPVLQAVAVPGAPAQWWLTLRHAYRALHRHADAVAAARAALHAAPDNPELLFALGQSLVEAGALAEAGAALAQSLALRPDHVPARLTHAHALLAAGDWAAGWDAYEWRLRRLAISLDGAPGPVWNGAPLGGGRLAVISEQGAGDALQFARFLPWAAARSGQPVALAVQAGLVPLLRGVPGVALCVPSLARLPDAAAHITLGSLPHRFAATADNLPPPPYLSADPAQVAAWRARLGPGRWVGLAWAGNPAFAADARRSLPFAALAPLLAVPGLRFVALHQRIPPADAAAMAAAGVQDVSALLGDFAATAALIAAVNLTISVDTAVAHLAGALGAKVWVLLMEPADWRWLRGRTDSPWYPQARLVRQVVPGAWDAVVARVAADAGAWAQRP